MVVRAILADSSLKEAILVGIGQYALNSSLRGDSVTQE
jgi:hypothetical protein